MSGNQFRRSDISIKYLEFFSVHGNKKPIKKLASVSARSGLSEFDGIFDNFKKDIEKSFSFFLRIDFPSFPKLHETGCEVIDEGNKI
jgi:hypothetical protein